MSAPTFRDRRPLRPNCCSSAVATWRYRRSLTSTIAPQPLGSPAPAGTASMSFENSSKRRSHRVRAIHTSSRSERHFRNTNVRITASHSCGCYRPVECDVFGAAAMESRMYAVMAIGTTPILPIILPLRSPGWPEWATFSRPIGPRLTQGASGGWSLP
jgi:hypothetical protein